MYIYIIFNIFYKHLYYSSVMTPNKDKYTGLGIIIIIFENGAENLTKRTKNKFK